jgi:hypothetical protein
MYRSSGGANVIRPSQWDNRDLPVFFSRLGRFPTLTPTRHIPSPTGGTHKHGSTNKRRAGTIAGATISSIVFVILTAAIAFFFIRRRTHHHNQEEPESKRVSRVELPSSTTPELHAMSVVHEAKPAVEVPEGTEGTFYQSQSSTETSSPVRQASEPVVLPPAQNTALDVFRGNVIETMAHGKQRGGGGHETGSSATAVSPSVVFPMGPYYDPQPTSAFAQTPTTLHGFSAQPPSYAMQPMQAFHLPLPVDGMNHITARPSPGPRTSQDISSTKESIESPVPGYPYPPPLKIVKSPSKEALAKEYKRDEKH